MTRKLIRSGAATLEALPPRPPPAPSGDVAEVHFFRKMALKKPLVVLAFPTAGGVGAIAAQFLVEQLKLPLVGAIRSKDLSATVIIRNGAAEPGIALYGKECACGPDGSCDCILVILGNVPMEGRAVWAVAEAVQGLLARLEAPIPVALEGVPVEETKDPGAVYLLAVGGSAKAMARKLKLGRIIEGALAGVTGALLSDALADGKDFLALVSEAHEEHLDARAAAALMKILSDHFVHMKFDVQPLLAEATRIEAEVRASAQLGARAEQRGRESWGSMYG